MRPDGKTVLERVFQQTAARLFGVSKRQAIEHIYDRIQEDLRNRYSLGSTRITRPPVSLESFLKALWASKM